METWSHRLSYKFFIRLQFFNMIFQSFFKYIYIKMDAHCSSWHMCYVGERKLQATHVAMTVFIYLFNFKICFKYEIHKYLLVSDCKM